MMTPEVVMDLGQDALMMTMMLAGPLLIAALAVGLFVGIFQADPNPRNDLEFHSKARRAGRGAFDWWAVDDQKLGGLHP